MNKVILIKYGELTTKKSNRKFFINTLYNNILKKLKDLDVVISKDMSRMYIEYDSINENLVLKRIGEIFGIHAYEIAYKVETDKDNILDTIKEVLSSNIDSNNYTFKVETKRSYKKFSMDSMECNHFFGSFILIESSTKTEPSLANNDKAEKNANFLNFLFTFKQ